MSSHAFRRHPTHNRNRPVGTRLSITTWNLGYGGLGAESDFVTDGGRSWLPPSRRAVQRNVQRIADVLSGDPSDVILVQEAATAGLSTYWVDMERQLRAAMGSREAVFQPDAWTRIPIPMLRLEHGLAVYSQRPIQDVESFELPQDGDINTGALRKRYAGLAIHLEGDPSQRTWTLIDVHLAAFDPEARLRRRQVEAVLAFAHSKYQAGHAVVIGGDWNLRLCQTSFAHDTHPSFLGWVADFDVDILPDGWRLACDPTTPSVRSNERAYRRGHNFTAVIDGFLVSPNVAIETVETLDLDFQWSDHQPVRGSFTIADP